MVQNRVYFFILCLQKYTFSPAESSYFHLWAAMTSLLLQNASLSYYISRIESLSKGLYILLPLFIPLKQKFSRKVFYSSLTYFKMNQNVQDYIKPNLCNLLYLSFKFSASILPRLISGFCF